MRDAQAFNILLLFPHNLMIFWF